MQLACYSYSANGIQLLGCIKENDNNFSLLLQDKKDPFADILGDNKYACFSSFQQALDYLENIVCSVLGVDNVNSDLQSVGDV